MGLTDAIAILQMHLATVYQLWGYLALAGAGFVTVAWTTSKPLDHAQKLYALAIFALCAVGNAIVLGLNHSRANIAASAIRAYTAAIAPAPTQLTPALQTVWSSSSVLSAILLHAGIDLVIVAAIWLAP